MKKSHPLDKEFDMEAVLYDEDNAEIIIPDDPNLDTIIEFALKAYKEQMDSLGLIEPKNRTRYLEICERFLGQAKDAIYKKEYIKIQRDRATRAPSVLPTPVPAAGGLPEAPVDAVDRKNLFSLVEGGK